MGTFIPILAQPAVAQGTNTTLPLTYPGRVLQGDGSQTCSSEEQREIVRKEVTSLLRDSVVVAIVPNLQTSCGGSTGWRCVAYLNMSDPSQQCPSVWQEITTPHRVCGRRNTLIADSSCEGLNYTTSSEQYDQVCGRIVGYQIGSTYAFAAGSGQSIDTSYVYGISVTHGSLRQHICTLTLQQHAWKHC